MSKVPHAPATFGRRLLAGQVGILLAMSVTMMVAALVVGPPIFNDHMRQSGHGTQPLVLEHAAEAFRTAGLISLSVGLVIAAAGALVVSAVLTKRLAAPLEAFAEATRRVAGGDYTTPLVSTDTSELATLAAGFNDMAARLAATETVRSRMLADLAHEMRTPLASILVLLDAIEDGVAQTDASTLATLRKQVDRLSRLTYDVRQVSAADEGHLALELSDVTAGQLLHRAREAFRERAAACGVDLVILSSATFTQRLRVDHDRIGQVLDNLLANALRHTPAGGRITLNAETSHAGIVLTVSDTGDGISAEHLPHVFDRFYRTDTARDRDHGGSGIGLTISRALARAHHGNLSAHSAGLGKGSVFALQLPTGQG